MTTSNFDANLIRTSMWWFWHGEVELLLVDNGLVRLLIGHSCFVSEIFVRLYPYRLWRLDDLGVRFELYSKLLDSTKP